MAAGGSFKGGKGMWGCLAFFLGLSVMKLPQAYSPNSSKIPSFPGAAYLLLKAELGLDFGSQDPARRPLFTEQLGLLLSHFADKAADSVLPLAPAGPDP